MTGERWSWPAAVTAVVLIAAAVVVAVLIVPLGPGTRHRDPGAPGVAATPEAGLPAPGTEAFGVNVNRLFNDFADTAAQIDGQLAAVRATGATVARSDALWEATEPRAPVAGRHDYDWSFDDAIAGALAAHGLTWLPILDYSPSWAASILGQDHSPPRSDADYAAYAAAFAARYGSDGTFWRAHPDLTPAPVTTIEIWNEPDTAEFWAPAPAAGRYADLYLAARSAIDGVNPRIRVIVGGLSDPTTFLPALVGARPALRGHVDGVAIHPYGSPAVIVARVRAARAVLSSVGMGTVPLYVTEFGWTTEPPGAVDYAAARVRPADITTSFVALGHLACGLAVSLLYTWVTPRRDPADRQDWYGIADPEHPGVATPDIRAFTAGLRAATQPGPARPCAG